MTDHRINTAACIGFGIIGSSWSVCFARAVDVVFIYDPSEEVVRDGLASAKEAFESLENAGLIDSAADSFARLQPVDTLTDAVSRAGYIQESAPERLEFKRSLFKDIDMASPTTSIIASSTSEIPPSQFISGLSGRARMIVAHPLNPPHLVPAIEICPCQDTSAETIDRASAFLRECGQAPLVMTKERNGFVMNRLQLAVLREAWSLVETGVCGPQDIDVAMRDGLARRWAVNGPFATNLLSTRVGYEHFIDLYGDTLKSIADDLSTDWSFDAAFGAKLDKVMGAPLDVQTYEEKTSSRNGQLLLLAAALRSSQKEITDV